MPNLPLIALTATAVPAVQADIRSALRLREPVFVSQQSAYRRNLAIACSRKGGDGARADLQPLLGQLRGKGGKGGKGAAVGPTAACCVCTACTMRMRTYADLVIQYHAYAYGRWDRRWSTARPRRWSRRCAPS
jgi:hypothetical protein